jgi:pyruvate/2-oxoglutarate dehydrogenase complex dihydrolipoamide dehydrogenase (E3) component
VDDSGVPGVFLAGDWVGAEGLLSDASFASARSVAHQLAQRLLLESA